MDFTTFSVGFYCSIFWRLRVDQQETCSFADVCLELAMFSVLCFALENSIHNPNAHDQGIDLLRGGHKQLWLNHHYSNISNVATCSRHVLPRILNVLVKEI